MPLLPLEPFLFPDDSLLKPDASLDEATPWWVLHTRPRAEKALARKLLRRENPFFLPLCKHQWRNRGRTHCSYIPLFPGYLFLKGSSQTIFQTLDTNLVAQILSVVDQHQLQDDLARVYHVIATGAPLAPVERLQPGDRVEITNGPLAGLEGKVVRKGKQLKFIVEVQFLQRGVSVEIESWMIQPSARAEPLPVTR
jgi:transcriptional antiterminator RfaH